MRPALRFLDDSLALRIVSEAREVLCTLGFELHNPALLSLLGDHGADVDAKRRHVRLTGALIDRALAAAPSEVALYDVRGRLVHRLAGDAVQFTPGSAAIHILDGVTGEIRRPDTADYVRYAKVVAGLPHIASQSTALIPADVPAAVSDSYRLYLSLLYCEKPVVTGAFSAETFEVMKDLQVAVRGSAAALREKPLTIFSCCPTSPLKWSHATSQNLVDCGASGIPAELIAMPLSGFVAPVTLVGTVIQHAAESLSGVVLSQIANPGAPLVWGGSPAVFDVRYETTPMGAIETMMIDCANAEIGKRLSLPTQAYIALSDAKRLDAQAGLETAAGAMLAALAGINSVSGPGMLDFESCQSLEKLVLDDEVCGMALRLVRGMEPRDDFPAVPLLRELLEEKHLLIARHTRRHLREEITFPGPVIDRASLSRWREEGGRSLGERATAEVERLVKEHVPSALADDVRRELASRMTAAARTAGLDALPARTE